MKILVTGKNGLLSSTLRKYAEKMDNPNLRFVFLGRDEVNLLNSNQTNDVIAADNPDLIIHTAASVGGIKYNLENKVQLLLDNLLIDSHVINSAVDSKIQNLLYFGSSCMFPIDQTKPLLESSIKLGTLEDTNFSYGLAKLTATSLINQIDKNSNLNYKVLVLSNLYGLADNFSLDTGHLVASVIRKVFQAKKINAKHISAWGTGKPLREFTLVDDVAKFILRNIDNISKMPSNLNLGVGSEYSVKRIYEIVMEVIKYKCEIRFEGSVPDGINSKLLDSSYARKHFDWNPEYELEKGVRMIVERFILEEKVFSE
jgi:nucleoside-diphosphate-sugar epimerase